jgi:hypothetical protein
MKSKKSAKERPQTAADAEAVEWWQSRKKPHYGESITPPASYTPTQKEIARRMLFTMKYLRYEIVEMCRTDYVLMLIFDDHPDGNWSSKPGSLPRSHFKDGPGETLKSPAPLLPGELASCWAFGVKRSTGENVLMRLIAVAETGGGDA